MAGNAADLLDRQKEDVAIAIGALALVSCSSEPDNGAIATVEADQARSAAAASEGVSAAGAGGS